MWLTFGMGYLVYTEITGLAFIGTFVGMIGVGTIIHLVEKKSKKPRK